MESRKIAGALGAEIRGADLAAGLGVAQAREIRQALLDHLVIFLRDQNLTPRQFLSFARLWANPSSSRS